MLIIVIGDHYNTLDSCWIQISQVLEVMGGLSLFIAIVYIIVGLACDTTDKLPRIILIWLPNPIKVLEFVAGLAQFSVRIWASVVVFRFVDFQVFLS